MKRTFRVTVDIDPKLEPDRIERLAAMIQHAINDCMDLGAKVRMLPLESQQLAEQKKFAKEFSSPTRSEDDHHNGWS